ncbi:transposable element gene, partial [Prunus dulcis]
MQTVDLQEVIAILKSQEQRLEMHSVDTAEKAFASFTVNSKGQNKNTSQSGSSKSQKSWNSKGKSWEAKDKSQQNNYSAQNHTSTQFSNQENTKPQMQGNLFYANCSTTEIKTNEWYIDSGCSNHMIGNLELLVDVRTNVAGRVQMPTGALVSVAGIGSLSIDTAKAGNIREVMYLPGLKENLLSVGQMDETWVLSGVWRRECAGQKWFSYDNYSIENQVDLDLKSDSSNENSTGTPQLWICKRALHQLQENSQAYDHTPLKWRRLDDVLAQCNLCIMEPEKYADAAQDESWLKAMEDELQMIEKNETWELVDRPTEKPVIGVKWVYKTKLNLDGSVQKNKARLVAKGYAQKPGLDYNETYAPVARLDTIRTLIALAAKKGWKLFQLDVKSAFLNGVLQEEVYVNQPEGFVIKGKEDKVYRLHKALYGLKQAPRAWYGEIDSYFTQCGFVKSLSEATLYTKVRGDKEILIVSIYVDDIVYTGSSQALLAEFKEDMMAKYEMTDLGLLHHFLGMGVVQTES